MGEEKSYAYDATGNLIEKIDAKNQKTQYIYNDIGGLTETQYFANAEDSTPAKTITWIFSAVHDQTNKLLNIEGFIKY